MEGKNQLVPALFKVTWNSARSGKRIALPKSTGIYVGDKFKCDIIQKEGEPLQLLYTKMSSPEEVRQAEKLLAELGEELENEKYEKITEISKKDIAKAERLHLRNIENQHPNDKFYDMEGT